MGEMNSPIKGNVGEWSEIYALIKLLGDGRLYAGDENMEKIENLFYPIIMILRQEVDNALNYVCKDKNILIETPSGDLQLLVPASRFVEEAENLLRALKDRKKGKGSFEIPATEKFMRFIKCHTLKAKSSDKADLHIKLHDQRTGINKDMGFSIKSQLGNRSTLLNASGATNFIYKVIGHKFTDTEIKDINAINTNDKVNERYGVIKSKGGVLNFDSISNDTFDANLTMLDGDMTKIVAAMLLLSADTGVKKFTDLAQRLAIDNPIRYKTDRAFDFYKYKLKNLLTTVALGMVPAKPWNGYYDANGGYIVVKEDGDIICYHFYDRNRFETYLFNNAELERPSTTRHGYGTLEKDEDGKLYFKFNLQIRLK